MTRMDVSEIETRLLRLRAAALAKGYKNPTLSMTLQLHGSEAIWVIFLNATGRATDVVGNWTHPTIESALAGLEKSVEALETLDSEQSKLKHALGKLNAEELKLLGLDEYAIRRKLGIVGG